MKTIVKGGQYLFVTHETLYAQCLALCIMDIAYAAINLGEAELTREEMHNEFIKNWHKFKEYDIVQELMHAPNVRHLAFLDLIHNKLVQAGVVNTPPLIIDVLAYKRIKPVRNSHRPELNEQSMAEAVAATSLRKLERSLIKLLKLKTPESVLDEVHINMVLKARGSNFTVSTGGVHD